MPDSEKGYTLCPTICCSVNPTHYFSLFVQITRGEYNVKSLHKWLEKMNKWTRFITLFIVGVNPLWPIAINGPRC